VSEAGDLDAGQVAERIRELTGQEISRPPRVLDDTTAVLRRFAVGDCPRYRAVDEVADEFQAVVGALGYGVS
jgi:hypothetical protein